MFRSREFQGELENLLNRYSVEQFSNTPDYILAQYLMDCLRTYETAVGSVHSHEKGFRPRV